MPEPERIAAEQRIMEAEKAHNRVNDDEVAATAEVKPTNEPERPPAPADFDHGPDDDHAFHNEFTDEAVAERESRIEDDHPDADDHPDDEPGVYRSGVAHGESLATSNGEGLWPAGLQDALTKRWQDVHLSFVDDPKSAVDQALSIVDDAVRALTSRLAARRRELGELGEADTEELRQAVQRCHALFDELVH
ncbi:hypothetical protein Afil01_21950 [Actinorhabdospora filicis]|uniref:Uncharacterized protein n=1 Tax=Actinorhabdospora filicis TaxID=1785913 RepID=A0A9W6SJH2_9ACTN|nr:hypothetical protein [Actinorhabdospora filicis]GLZ77388.1 hypothetical protein Afil01_21950 [Actinorhabdospora filicis]